MTIHEIDVGLGGGSLLQVANRSPVQMMSYVIDTPEGKTILIDGGYRRPEDAAHLRELIRERGDRVVTCLARGKDPGNKEERGL